MRPLRAAAWLSLVAVLQSIGLGAGIARAQLPPNGAYPPPAPNGAYPPPLPQPVLAAPVWPVVRLRADDPEARLQVLQPKWRNVCAAPCEIPLDPRGLYRIGGGRVTRSAPFGLPSTSGEVSIDVKAGSSALRWTGVGLELGGAVATLFGVLALGNGGPDQGVQSQRSDSAEIVAISLLVVGVVLEVTGIALWYNNRTQVQVR